MRGLFLRAGAIRASLKRKEPEACDAVPFPLLPVGAPLMCRWAAYTGAPIFLEEIVSRPGHSLIHQSHCATQCHSAINADGFGVAWYGDRPD